MLRCMRSEPGLPEEFDYVIGLLKYMLKIHESNVRELAQAQNDEIQQMKRDYTYATHQLNTQKARELKAATEVSIIKDAIIEQQEGSLVLRNAKIANLQISGATDRDCLQATRQEILELNERLADLQDMNRCISYWKGRAATYKDELSAHRSNTAGSSNQDAIARNETESRGTTESRSRRNNGTNYGMTAERIRIKNLKAVCERHHAALQVRYDNLRHKAVKLELPLDSVRVTTDMEKQQKMVVKEMEDLMFWLHKFTKELRDRDLGLLDLMDIPGN